MEFAWYLSISWAQIDAPIEQIVADFRRSSGQRFDARALDLGFLLALVHLGWNKAIAAIDNPDPEGRRRERDHLAWWATQVRRTLEFLATSMIRRSTFIADSSPQVTGLKTLGT